MAEHEVTLGEVNRKVDRVLAELADFRKDSITRREHEANQVTLQLRFEAQAKALAEWKEESTAAHVQLERDIEKGDTKLATRIDHLDQRITDHAAEQTRMKHEASEGSKNRRLTLVGVVLASGLALLASLFNLLGPIGGL